MSDRPTDGDTKIRDTWPEVWQDCVVQAYEENKTPESQLYQHMLKRVAKLREALKPFAELADVVDEWRHEDNSTCPHRLRAGDLRTARAALQATEPERRQP